jgi:hypothetical protein
MSTETDILATLKRIELAITRSSTSSSASRAKGAVGGSVQRDSADSAKRENKQAIVASTKTVDKFTVALGRSTYSLRQFEKHTTRATDSISNLNTVVGKSIAQINGATASFSKSNFANSTKSMQKAIEAAAESISSVKIGFDPRDIERGIAELNTMFGSMRTVSKSLTEFKRKINNEDKLTAAGGKRRKREMSIATAINNRAGIADSLMRMSKLLREVNKQLRSSRSLLARANRAGGGVRASGGGGGGGGHGHHHSPDMDDTPKGPSVFQKAKGVIKSAAAAPFKKAASEVFHSLYEIINNAFDTTAARGFGTTSNLTELYVDAMKAGVSLKEYARILDENAGAVSRSTSFADFDKQLDYGRDSLRKFGVFGEDATKLSASMISSSQALGIPMSSLKDSVDGQMKAFEELRKKTGLTANQFQQLVEQLQDNEVIQKEMLGLSPKERAARQQELLQIASIGTSMGMSARQANQLTQAMIDQRKSTVKERFQQRGRIMQGFALAGMSTQDAQEAAALAGKRMKTPEETKRYLELMGQYQQRSEAVKQSGGPGMQYQMEAMDEKLAEAGLSPTLEAAGNLQLAKEAGPTGQNKDTNKTLGGIEQKAGEIMTWLQGYGQSPFAAALVGGIGIIASTMWQTRLARLIGAEIRGALGMGGLGGGGKGPGGLGGGGGNGTYNKWRERGAAVRNKVFGDPNFVGPKQPLSDRLMTSVKNAGSSLKESIFGQKLPNGVMGPPKPGLLKSGLNGLKNMSIGGAVIGGLSLFSGIAGYMDAENAAKPENGGDGDVGKEKGKAIGETIGSVAGLAVGTALAPFTFGLSELIAPLAGGALGKWLGGLIGSKNATEKLADETKKNTDEMVKARNASAGASVVATDNLSSLGSNISQTAMAYASATPGEQKAASKKALISSFMSQGYSANDAAKAADAQLAGTTFTPSPAPGSVASVVQGSAAIATPVAPALAANQPTIANPGSVNTPDTAQPSTTVASAAVAPALQNPSDSAALLQQIIKLLQQLVDTEEEQLDVSSQLLKSTGRKLPDNYQLTKVALSRN